jgi:predicted nucleic acid-binding protein
MILDTNAVSALLEGNRDIVSVLESEEKHHLPVIVIGEYFFGLIDSRMRIRLNAVFRRLIDESNVLDVDQTTAEYYSAIRSELKQKGRPLPDNDIWIAALARHCGLPIVSRDSHFDDIDGIRRISW